MYRKHVHNVLFWLHIGVILFGLFIGLLISLPIVLFLVLLHRIHMIVFKDCLLSKLQKYLRGFPEYMSFLQFASLRLFGKNISLRQSNRLDYTFALFSVTIALLHTL